MRPFLRTALVMFLVGCASVPDPLPDPHDLEPLPDPLGLGPVCWLQAPEVNGELFQDRLVVIAFLDRWIPELSHILDSMAALQAQYGSRGLLVIACLQSDDSTVVARINARGVPFPVFVDNKGSTAERFSVEMIPQCVVLTPGLNTVFRGHPDRPDFSRTVAASLAGLKLSGSSTEFRQMIWASPAGALSDLAEDSNNYGYRDVE